MNSFLTYWAKMIETTIIYERRREINHQVLYVVPIESILGRLPVVPIGDTGTIPHASRADFPNSWDGSQCWFVNNWAMGWSPEI